MPGGHVGGRLRTEGDNACRPGLAPGLLPHGHDRGTASFCDVPAFLRGDRLEVVRMAAPEFHAVADVIVAVGFRADVGEGEPRPAYSTLALVASCARQLDRDGARLEKHELAVAGPGRGGHGSREHHCFAPVDGPRRRPKADLPRPGRSGQRRCRCCSGDIDRDAARSGSRRSTGSRRSARAARSRRTACPGHSTRSAVTARAPGSAGRFSRGSACATFSARGFFRRFHANPEPIGVSGRSEQTRSGWAVIPGLLPKRGGRAAPHLPPVARVVDDVADIEGVTSEVLARAEPEPVGFEVGANHAVVSRTRIPAG